MPRKKHKPEQVVAKLRQVHMLSSQRRPVGGGALSLIAFTYYLYGWLSRCKSLSN